MKRGFGYAAALSVIAAPVTAEAGQRIVLQPIQVGPESVRFDHGDFVVDQASAHAAVQVRPASDDHGQLSFVVLVMNTGLAPINVEVANIRVEGTDQPVRLVTRTEMEQKAARRAGWATFANVLGSSLLAAGQANQRNHYSATTQTRFGTVSTHFSAPCYSCRADADQTLAEAGARTQQIRAALDGTRDALREQAFQLTTIDPGRYYGGRIYLSKFKPKPLSPIRLVVTVGEEAFPFAFRFAPDGTATPQYRMAATAVAPTMALATPAAAVRPASAITRAPMMAVVVPTATASAQPIAVTYTPAPRPRARPAVSGVVIKWQGYYDALLASGVSRTQAHSMADEQFGAID